MPIRNILALALTLATTLAGGAAFAENRDLAIDVPDKAQPRDLRPVPGAAEPGASQRPQVALRPSSPVVPVGAPISFEISSSVNGFGHLYVLSASGRAQVWMENVPISAGRPLFFPTGSTVINATAPSGREDLMLIVTRERVEGIFGYRVIRTPRTVDYDHRSFKQVLTAKFADLPRRQWSYDRVSVRVVDRGAPGYGSGGFGSGWGATPAAPDAWGGDWESD